MTNDPSSGCTAENIGSIEETDLEAWIGCIEELGLMSIVGTIVRVMVTGSRRVRYSVLTSSSGVIIVRVPLKSVAKYVYVE